MTEEEARQLYDQYMQGRGRTSPTTNTRKTSRYETPDLYQQEEDTLAIKRQKQQTREKEKQVETEAPAESLKVDTTKITEFKEYVIVGTDTVQVIVKPMPKVLKRFGEDFFKMQGEGPQVTVGDMSPVSDEYILGPGDQVVLSIWGGVTDEQTLTVDREGKVVIPVAGTVVAAGHTISQFRSDVNEALSRVYQDFQTSLMLGRVKGVNVRVVGSVKKPGTYMVTSLSTVLDALTKAGGPTDEGTMRDVRVVRSGKVFRFDLYDFLLQGNTEDNLLLASGDVITVGAAGPLVKARGRIRRPAIYEMRPNETLADLLSIAGGLMPDAATDKITIDRIRNGRHQIADAKADSASARAAILYDGDDIGFWPIPDERYGLVYLEGEVTRPGVYELHPGMRILDLLDGGKRLQPVAYRRRADLLRTRPDYRREIVAIDLDSAILGTPNENLELESNDKLTIFSIWDVEPRRFVYIDGAVPKKGKYELFEHMRIADLVFEAGGPTRDAYLDRADLARSKPGEQPSVTSVNLHDVLKGGSDMPDNALLQENDHLFVRHIPEYKREQIVTLTGEFKFPGDYTILADDEKLSSLITRAGGFTSQAFLEGALYVRSSISKDLARQNLQDILNSTQEIVEDTLGNIKSNPLLITLVPEKMNRIIINLKDLVQGKNSSEDMVVQQGDSIYVPKIPSGVHVAGSVGSPGTIKYVSEQDVDYYLDKAGGLTRNADGSEVRLVKADGKVYKSSVRSRIVDAGDAIIVPQRITKESDVLKTLGQIVTIASGLLISAFTVIFLAKK